VISAPSEKSGENAATKKSAYNIQNEINQSVPNTEFEAQSLSFNDGLIGDTELEFNTEDAARRLALQPRKCRVVCYIVYTVPLCRLRCKWRG
jgi:hypothetical protein